MRDNVKLEKHFNHNEHVAVERFTYRNMDVFISEGGNAFFDNKIEFPLGYYETSYSIGRGDQILFYMPLIFDYLHDIQMSAESRAKARITTTKNTAIEHIDLAGGLYHG